MITPQRAAWLLKQFAQSCRCNAVVKHPADSQIGALFTLILAEPARQAHSGVQPVTLHVLIDDGEIFSVPPGEAGTAKANNDFYDTVIREHGLPLYACNCTNCEAASGGMLAGDSFGDSFAPRPPGPTPGKRPSE